ncbi:hypothetical protein [Phytohabitans aurantiacus]|jgi:hypothetical protein|uniref:Uncharacterized protein n=1 Tax=Phytohabitans aurantiacus TaxID=3016789 RepID=A0ABQ5R7T0_9ACTN|nr:hypothetical protein [Phytohabitans aurantiacus]GLI02822.1 hypothetical protein Pa4123_81000 [Phytohabitans aurantiacus]
MSSVARFLRSRRRQITLAVLLGVTGTFLLVAGVWAPGYAQEIMVNLGASLVMVALSFVVFDPIFEDMRRNAVEEHRTLNHDQLVTNIAAARVEVDILETWTGLLEDRYRDRFLDAVTTAVRAGVGVRVLLLDPESSAAEQRAEELHHTQVPLLIMDNLRHLYTLRRSLDPLVARQLQVRVYDASPSIQLYRWDDKSFISFFPVGVRAYDARQIEAFMSSPLGEFVSSRFEDLWSESTTRTLEDFMSLRLTIRLGTDNLATSDAHFVRLDGDCFVDGSSLLDHLTDHGARRLSLAVGGLRDAIFDMVRLDQHDPARRATVVALFDAKYGSGHDHRVILRLVPRAADSQPLAH